MQEKIKKVFHFWQLFFRPNFKSFPKNFITIWFTTIVFTHLKKKFSKTIFYCSITRTIYVIFPEQREQKKNMVFNFAESREKKSTTGHLLHPMETKHLRIHHQLAVAIDSNYSWNLIALCVDFHRSFHVFSSKFLCADTEVFVRYYWSVNEFVAQYHFISKPRTRMS